MKKFREIEINVKRLINNFESGTHLSGLKDSIIDIDTIREYQPGDKRPDPKASLKTHRLMSKVFNPEKLVKIYLLLDLSSSIYNKLEQAITISLFFCYLAEIHSDQLGLISFADKVNFIEATQDISLITRFLEKVKYEEDKGSNFAGGLLKLQQVFPKDSLIILISDFYFDFDEKLLKSFAQYNEIFAIVLTNPLEFVDIPFQIDFVDAENGKLVRNNKKDFAKWKAELSKKMKCIFLDINDNYLINLIKRLI